MGDVWRVAVGAVRRVGERQDDVVDEVPDVVAVQWFAGEQQPKEQQRGWQSPQHLGVRGCSDLPAGLAAGQDVDQPVPTGCDEADIVVATPLLTGTDGGAWLLIAGRWVASEHDSTDTAALSTALDCEVQRFVTHRVVEGHGWERAVSGGLVRSFEYLGESGEVTRWHGDPDKVELWVGLPTTFDLDHGSGSESAWFVVDEDDEMRVAGRGVSIQQGWRDSRRQRPLLSRTFRWIRVDVAGSRTSRWWLM